MKNDLCEVLKILANFGASADAAKQVNNADSINVIWEMIIKAIQEPGLLTEAETKKLLNLDRIMKWEFLDYEKPTFDWSAISWSEIGEEARLCSSSICSGRIT